MKFKAVLSRNGVKTFVSIAQSIQKVAEECAIHMNEEFFEFRVKPDAANGIQVFAKMHTESFTEYRIESKAENNITVVVRVRNLIRAFKSADQAMDAVFKLTKPGSIPCFTVVASDVTTCLAVKQDIPISQILSAAGRNEYREPRLPTPDIAMEFPDPRHVKMILEKMKPLDKFVHMEASSRGVLIFKVQTELVSMRTFFHGLEVQQSKGSDVQEENNMNDNVSVHTSNSFNFVRKYVVQMNIKEFLNVLHFASIHFEKVILCVIEGQAVVLYGDLEDSIGSLTYYIPVCTAFD
mmetsp:Transcript_4760/g.5883  ORF Transcript_4760/g.5883 Transcript_4760/m.5883 type:complete len:294 (+) Transcript_4760:215-1096(+)